jgi:hypothetical protein
MESKYKILIPKPCHENWEGMTPNSQGKFCGSCQKNVVDFTNKSAVEIQNYFAENTGKRICGRFEKTQLNSITLQIPHQLLFSQVHFHKMFLLALLIVMGTSLFSCSDSDGNKQKIDKVEVTEKDAAEELSITLGILIPPDPSEAKHFDHLPPPPPPAPKINEVQFVKPTEMEKVKVTQTKPKKLILSEELSGEVVVRKDSLNHNED